MHMNSFYGCDHDVNFSLNNLVNASYDITNIDAMLMHHKPSQVLMQWHCIHPLPKVMYRDQVSLLQTTSASFFIDIYDYIVKNLYNFHTRYILQRNTNYEHYQYTTL